MRREFVINIISDWFVEAANFTCIDFDRGVDEAMAAGLTRTPSVKVRPPRIAEAVVQLECKLHQIIPLEDRYAVQRCEHDAVLRGNLLSVCCSLLPKELNTTDDAFRDGVPSASIILGKVVLLHIHKDVTELSPTGGPPRCLASYACAGLYLQIERTRRPYF